MYSILYVDDEPALLEIGRLFLEHSGDFQVAVMASAQEALDSPSLGTYDAIVSDYQMPDMDGIEFLKAVRERHREIPFLIFTGRGREEVVIEAINNGADFYVQKGGDPTAQFAELAHKIRQAVRRKEAESSQRESERRLADIIDFLPDAMLAVDPAGRVLAWNRANEDLTGVPASRMLGKGNYEYALSPYGERRPFLLDMLSWPDEEIRKYFTNIVHDGRAISAETNLAAPKGRQINIMVKAGPLFNQKGEVTGAIEIVRDITERLRAQEDLQKTENRFAALFSNMREGTALHKLILDDQGQPVDYVILATNPAFEHHLGISRESVRGKTSREAYGVSEPPYLDVYARVTLTGRPEIFETYFAPMKKHFSISAYSPQKNRFVTIFEDITEKKRAEAKFRESAEKYRALVETSPDMIWEIDCSGKFRYISPTVETILGYLPEELVGKPVTCLVPEQGMARAQRELEKFFAADKSIAPFEVPARHRDGHDMVIEIRSFPVTGPEGNVTGFRGVARDVTEQKKAGEHLRRANRQLTLLGSVSRHDSLNKITVILGYLKIASKKCADPAVAELLKKMESALTAMRSQIEFTRVYQNLGSGEPQWNALEASLSGLQVPAQISLVADVGGIRLLADPMFGTVFANLLDNSVRHGEHVTEIRVSSCKKGTALAVIFEDNGIGVVEADKERIFDRGYGKNTGLGLFLVREILGLTGISIRETGIPGKGARFEIIAPEGAYRLDAAA